MVRREKSNYVIQSVSHALDVLEQFNGTVDEIGVLNLANDLNCIKTTFFVCSLPSKRAVTSNKIS